MTTMGLTGVLYAGAIVILALVSIAQTLRTNRLERRLLSLERQQLNHD